MWRLCCCQTLLQQSRPQQSQRTQNPTTLPEANRIRLMSSCIPVFSRQEEDITRAVTIADIAARLVQRGCCIKTYQAQKRSSLRGIVPVGFCVVSEEVVSPSSQLAMAGNIDPAVHMIWANSSEGSSSQSETPRGPEPGRLPMFRTKLWRWVSPCVTHLKEMPSLFFKNPPPMKLLALQWISLDSGFPSAQTIWWGLKLFRWDEVKLDMMKYDEIKFDETKQMKWIEHDNTHKIKWYDYDIKRDEMTWSEHENEMKWHAEMEDNWRISSVRPAGLRGLTNGGT